MQTKYIEQVKELPTVTTSQVFFMVVGSHSKRIYGMFHGNKRNNVNKAIQHYYKALNYANSHAGFIHKQIEIQNTAKEINSLDIQLPDADTKHYDYDLPGLNFGDKLSFAPVRIGSKKDNFVYPVEPLTIQKVLVPAKTSDEYKAGRDYLKGLADKDAKWFNKNGCKRFISINHIFKINGSKL